VCLREKFQPAAGEITEEISCRRGNWQGTERERRGRREEVKRRGMTIIRGLQFKIATAGTID